MLGPQVELLLAQCHESTHLRTHGVHKAMITHDQFVKVVHLNLAGDKAVGAELIHRARCTSQASGGGAVHQQTLSGMKI